jgi:hypothetical protein
MQKGEIVNITALDVNDVVISKVPEGHLLYIVTPRKDERLSLLYRGDGWTVPYAVARGAKLAGRRGGNLWYTSNQMTTVEYLEAFPARRSELVN